MVEPVNSYTLPPVNGLIVCHYIHQREAMKVCHSQHAFSGSKFNFPLLSSWNSLPDPWPSNSWLATWTSNDELSHLLYRSTSSGWMKVSASLGAFAARIFWNEYDSARYIWIRIKSCIHTASETFWHVMRFTALFGDEELSHLEAIGFTDLIVILKQDIGKWSQSSSTWVNSQGSRWIRYIRLGKVIVGNQTYIDPNRYACMKQVLNQAITKETQRSSP